MEKAMINEFEIASFVMSHFPEAEQTNVGWRVRCPNPDHIDNNPSCTIFKNSGGYYCFSCGSKGGFRALQKLVGEDNKSQVTKEEVLNALTIFKRKSENPVQDNTQLELTDIDRPWRDFSPEFLNGQGCRFWYNTEYFKPQKTTDETILKGISQKEEGFVKKKELIKTNVTRIYMPFMLRGIRIGWTGRKIKNIILKNGSKYNPVKYRIGPKGFKALNAIYGYDNIPVMADRIFICEGPVSALRLVSYGLDAISAISATSWSDYKLQLVLAKQPKFVYVCGDGDEAGKKFNDTVFTSIKPFLKVKRLELPDGEDPDSVDKSFWKKWI